ncbi:MAG: radical SAM protein [Bdellovibrionaceae bacterium]|nr:radical SAM protein [Pseudobdellovibrionaceae bacterium]
MENQELFIDLGRACNFACSHCLNNSGPHYTVDNLEPLHLNAIVDAIETNTSIKKIHFSGGEPTLYKSTILMIQAHITRPVKYALTSNGSLGEKFTEWMADVILDTVSVSIDQWHSPFVTQETLKGFLSAAIDRQLEVEIECVVDSLADLDKFSWLSVYSLAIQPRFRIACGRSRSGPNQAISTMNLTCPSLTRNPKKINWQKDKGFSICCGPLLFDDLQDDNFLFSQEFSKVSQTPISMILKNNTFADLLMKFGISKQFSSPCEACRFLFRLRSDLGNVSFFDILSGNRRYFKINQRVMEQTWREINPDYKLTYFVINETPQRLDPGCFLFSNLESHGVKKANIRSFGINGLLSFVQDNFFDRWKEHRTRADYENLAKITPAYYEKDLRGCWYLKNEKPIALLMYTIERNHSAVNRDVIHIGHWGYLPTEVSRAEAQSIKYDWINSLREASTKSNWMPVAGVIDDFNEASLSLSQTLGFEIHSFRLDKRGHDHD